MNNKKEFYSIPEIAKILNISRISVFNKVKKGDIIAQKVGRNYIISKSEVLALTTNNLTIKQKKEIDESVSKVIKEYGVTLKLLAKE